VYTLLLRFSAYLAFQSSVVLVLANACYALAQQGEVSLSTEKLMIEEAFLNSAVPFQSRVAICTIDRGAKIIPLNKT